MDNLFSPLEQERYRRQLQLPGFGLEKQYRLKSARVLLVGTGGLGCPIALYLAAAGIGTLGVVDFDQVSLENLHRQVVFSTQSVGKPKVDCLLETLHQLNPLVTCVPYPGRLTAETVCEVMSQYDLVVDGTDNYETKFFLADSAYLARVSLLHGALYQYQAQVALFVPGQGACYRCLYREPPQSHPLAACNQAGVLGVVPGTVGLLMATEAIKHLTGMDSPLTGKLLIYDALKLEMRHFTLAQDADCPLCGSPPKITAPQDKMPACRVGETERLITVAAAQAMVAAGNGLWIDVRELEEYEAGHIPGALSLPLSMLSEDTVSQIHRNVPWVVYCQSGQRSLYAVEQLQTWGIASCHSLQGGFSNWLVQSQTLCG